jgi:predicted dehydrogenase
MTHQHIQNAHRSKVCRIHTLCDLDVPKMQAVARKYPPVKMTADYRRMLADPEVQLVVIAMSPEKHAALAIEAMRAGKDVYVEKPMGVSVAECRRIARVAKQTGRRVTTGFNRRFAPAYADLKPYLKDRAGGLKIFYRIADFERWQRADADRVLHEVVHIFDILCFFTDSQPVSIFANRGSHHNDTIIALSFADQSIATILSTGLTGSIPKEHVELHWDRQAAEVESFIEARYYHVPGAPLVKRYAGRVSDAARSHDYVKAFASAKGMDCLRSCLREAWSAYDAYEAGKLTREQVVSGARGYIEDKGWAAALDEMAWAILEGRPATNATAVEGTRAVVMAMAANKSIATGRAVKLDKRQWSV